MNRRGAAAAIIARIKVSGRNHYEWIFYRINKNKLVGPASYPPRNRTPALERVKYMELPSCGTSGCACGTLRKEGLGSEAHQRRTQAASPPPRRARMSCGDTWGWERFWVVFSPSVEGFETDFVRILC